MSVNEGKLDVTSMYISIDDLEKSGDYCWNSLALLVVQVLRLGVVSGKMRNAENSHTYC